MATADAEERNRIRQEWTRVISPQLAERVWSDQQQEMLDTVHKALQKDRANRFQTADEMLEALRDAMDDYDIFIS